jgi:hypothetical protein
MYESSSDFDWHNGGTSALESLGDSEEEDATTCVSTLF